MSTKQEHWTIGSILRWTGQYFSEKGVDSPRLDAEVLLSHVLGKDRLYLYVHFDQPLEGDELATFREVVKKRAARVPIAYIIGQKEFMGLDFIVTPDTLIPRPDTEILVEAALNRLQPVDKPSILDLGTGSGAIIISLLHNLPEAAGTAVDISEGALSVTRQNAARHKAAERLTLLKGDLFEPVTGVFDAILSNPPYIPDAEIAGLQPEVRREPVGALAGGKDGLDFYRRIVATASGYVKTGGFLALEVGIGQAQDVAALAHNTPFTVEEIIKDYGGVDRVVILQKQI